MNPKAKLGTLSPKPGPGFIGLLSDRLWSLIVLALSVRNVIAWDIDCRASRSTYIILGFPSSTYGTVIIPQNPVLISKAPTWH